MRRFLYSPIIFFIAISFACLGFFACAKSGEEKDVDLQIACVLAKSGPTLLFTLTNKSNFDIGVFDVRAYPSRLVITTPSGTVRDEFFYGDPAAGHRWPVVKPKEKKTWQIDISRMFISTDRYPETGIYRLQWKVTKWISDKEKVDFESNEILLAKEKDTPLIDPATAATQN